MKKIITYGTFDLFHQGHFNILKRAKEMGDYLIVGVTGADYDVQRGKINVQDSLVDRIQNIRKTGLADEIIVEEYEGQKIDDILKYSVDVLVLGSDWRGKFDYLMEYCEVVYLERTKNISSSVLRNQYQPYRLGIITDDELACKSCVEEVRFVTGVHYQCVLCDDETMAKKLYDTYELDEYFCDIAKFIQNINIAIVCLCDDRKTRAISQLLKNKIHVISSSPLSFELDELQKLYQTAYQHNVLLCEDLRICYLHEFERLLSIVKSKKIGKIVSIKSRIGQSDIIDHNSLVQHIEVFILIILKIFNEEIKKESLLPPDSSREKLLYELDIFKTDTSFAQLEYGSRVVEESHLTIVGNAGIISIPGKWWNLNYYELINLDGKVVRRYSSNYEGNGFRYVLKEVLYMIANHRKENTKLSYENSKKIIEIYDIKE